MTSLRIKKNKQYYKFALYGFLKNLRFFEPFIVIFLLSKNISLLEIGILFSIREITKNIFEIPSGIIADTIGRRKILAFAFLIYILSFLTFYFFTGFIFFMIAVIFFAIGDAFRSGVNKAIITTYLEYTNQIHLKTDYYGHTRSWSQIGSAISSLAGGVILFFSKKYNLIFLLSTLPYIIDFFIILSYPKNLDKPNHKFENISIKNKFIEIFKTFILTIKNRKQIKLLANISVYSGLYKTLKEFIQPILKLLILQYPIFLYLTDKQRISIGLAIIYFLIFIVNSFASRYAFKVSKLFKSENKFLNFTLLIGIATGILSGIILKFYSSIFIIVLLILIFLIENLRKPSGVNLITHNSDKKIHSSILSLNSQLASLFAAIFMILIGIISKFTEIPISITIISLMILILYPLIKVK